MKQPRERHLHRTRVQGCRDRIQLRGLQRGESAQREEGYIRNSLRGEFVHKGTIISLGDIEKVLYADDLRDLLRLSQLLTRDVAETEVLDQPLTLEFGERGQRLFDRSLRGLQNLAHAEIHYVELLQPEVPKIIVNRIDQFLPGKGVNPRLVRSTPRAHLSDNHQILVIWVQRLFDDLIGYMRTVVITGIEVVHAGVQRFAQ